MKRHEALLCVAVALFTLALSCAGAIDAGEPPVVSCTTDADCAQKNPLLCGGPYAPACPLTR